MTASANNDPLHARALELARDGMGCRAIAKRLKDELGADVSKSKVDRWLREAAGPDHPAKTPPQFVKASHGTSQDDARDVPDAPNPESHRLARATLSAGLGRVPEGVPEAKTKAERVNAVADLLDRGQWDGRRTARKLAEAWGLSHHTVFTYMHEAARSAGVDQGARAELRQVSMGRWKRLQRRALRDGDVKAAVAAQAGWDKASGVVEPGGTKVYNVAQDPLRGILQLALDAMRAAGDEGLSAADGYERALGAMRKRLSEVAGGGDGRWLEGPAGAPTTIDVHGEEVVSPVGSEGAS